MNTKNHRVPLALALVTLVVAALAPVSGAQSEQPFYESVAEPGAPAWRITKLDVTEEGIVPTLKVQFTEAVCPLTWGFSFVVGSPESAWVYNGQGFALGGGAGGISARAGGVTIGRDQDSGCATADVWTIIFGELPLGTVYLLETRSGSDFRGWARLYLSGPGVEKVASSVGFESMLLSQDDFEGRAHVGVASPHMCVIPNAPSPDAPCSQWAGGSRANMDVGIGRVARARFEHHPWFAFQTFGVSTSSPFSSVGNASMMDPLGGVTYAGSPQVTALGLAVNPQGIRSATTGLPPGEYEFRIDLNVDANPTGWWATWWDLEFPEEQAAGP